MSRWGKVVLVNHAAATLALDTQADLDRWYNRRGPLMTEVVGIGADVVMGLECGGTAGGAWHYISTKYDEAGYSLVIGKAGRNMWVKRSTVTVESSGVLDPPRGTSGNDKPAPWMLGTINGSRALVVGGHFDPFDTDGSTQVKQATFVVAEAEKIATAKGLTKSRIVFAFDTAFKKSGIVVRCFTDAGYVDAFHTATTTAHKGIRSANYYKPPVAGYRVDRVFIHQTRPVDDARQVLTLKTDHHHQAVALARRAAP